MGKLDQYGKGMLQRMDVEKLVKEIETHTPAGRAVNSERHVEFFRCFVNRIEIRVTVPLV